MHIRIHQVDWDLTSTFKISYRARTQARTVLVEVSDGELKGRGEALGVSYHGETAESIVRQLQSVVEEIERGISREDAQSLLPPGGARNALDCALWDLAAKRARRRAWTLAGIPRVRSLITDYTLSLDTPENMGQASGSLQQYPVLKIKLCGDKDVDRVAAVRAARPDVQLIVDANQAWSVRQLHAFAPALRELGVKLIEQPLAAEKDWMLIDYDSPVPLCADESCQTSESLPDLIGKYEYINIKLDKTGGLTEALRLVQAARAMGFKLMVGCMGGSSISMAPAFIVGQWCEFADLDGPLWSKEDVPYGIRYDGGRMSQPAVELWG